MRSCKLAKYSYYNGLIRFCQLLEDRFLNIGHPKYFMSSKKMRTRPDLSRVASSERSK